MAARPTNFQQFDEGDEFEVIPPSELDRGIVAATECCVCSESPGELCSAENSAGQTGSLLVGQTLAFWYVK